MFALKANHYAQFSLSEIERMSPAERRIMIDMIVAKHEAEKQRAKQQR